MSLSDLALAVRATLEEHFPSHVADLARPLPAPDSWALVPTPDNILRVKGVQGGVSAVSTDGEPVRRQGGYDAWCTVSVFLFHQHSTATPVDIAPGDYASALAECLDHHQSLGDFAAGFRLTSVGANIVGDGLTPSTLGYASAECSFLVRDFLTRTPHGNSAVSTVLTTDTTLTRL